MELILGIVIGAAFSKFWLTAWNTVVPVVKGWFVKTPEA